MPAVQQGDGKNKAGAILAASGPGRVTAEQPSRPVEVEWRKMLAEDAVRPSGQRFWLSSLLGAGIGALLALLLLIVAGGYGGDVRRAALPLAAPDQADGGVAAPREGQPAPLFTLRDLDGRAISLQDLRGQPVWINMWASWCTPCREEMPEIERLYAGYRVDGLVVLGVDVGEDAGAVRSFVGANGYSWHFLLDGDKSMGRKYNTVGIPTHAFIDRAGVLRGYSIGGLSAAAMEDYLARIVAR